ncbi:hypothetical protein [Wolbachia endosymbiont of Mansonella perstans]|uniref:hypothetical protein n=1 Tax=Wolbachia endosymbiont of Mansonella perstans TaxID=229526 RepID=UPI001CE15ABE|nr:hypothetical protein [Wolbachia endosymbiont of Mansonella perstans]MCA4773985.1 hypothetical protein [Wolbachia endosymbiont of Mansonella perstans]
MHTLVKNVNNHGMYEGSKEYLQKVANYLNDSCIMESDKLQNLETNLNKPDLTKEQFTQITTDLVSTIDSSKIDKFDRREQRIVGDYIQRLVEERKNNEGKRQIDL